MRPQRIEGGFWVPWGETPFAFVTPDDTEFGIGHIQVRGRKIKDIMVLCLEAVVGISVLYGHGGAVMFRSVSPDVPSAIIKYVSPNPIA